MDPDKYPDSTYTNFQTGDTNISFPKNYPKSTQKRDVAGFISKLKMRLGSNAFLHNKIAHFYSMF